MIGKDHFNIEPANNSCISDIAYYYEVNNSYVKSYNGFSEHANHSAKVLRNGENKVEFVFENSTDYQKALDDLENDNGFFNYVFSAVKNSRKLINPHKVTYYTIDDRNYLCIIFG